MKPTKEQIAENEARKFVSAWLWESEKRETRNLEWPNCYRADAEQMVLAATQKLRSTLEAKQRECDDLTIRLAEEKLLVGSRDVEIEQLRRDKERFQRRLTIVSECLYAEQEIDHDKIRQDLCDGHDWEILETCERCKKCQLVRQWNGKDYFTPAMTKGGGKA